MSIFSKIGKAFGGRKADGGDAEETAKVLLKELETLNKDGRLHARYMLQGGAIARIRLESGLEGIIRDISYGGLAVRFEGSNLPASLPSVMNAEMFVLDQKIDCKVTTVRSVQQNAQAMFAGFSLHHENSATLIFLRELIEPLRCGMSLTLLPADSRNDRYKGKEWNCLRGDGPTDIVLRSGPDPDRLEEALMTFRRQGNYCELSYKNGEIRTGRGVDGPSSTQLIAVGTLMQSNAEPDRAVLRQAIYILVSAPDAIRKLAQPIITRSMEALDDAQRRVVA